MLKEVHYAFECVCVCVCVFVCVGGGLKEIDMLNLWVMIRLQRYIVYPDDVTWGDW